MTCRSGTLVFVTASAALVGCTGGPSFTGLFPRASLDREWDTFAAQVSVPDHHGRTSWRSRSCDAPLGTWLPGALATMRSRARALDTVQAGVCVTDLAVYSLTCMRGTMHPSGAVLALLTAELTWLVEDFPQMGVRDAIGWTLASNAGEVTCVDLAQAWAVTGAGDDAYLLHAAGLTPAEAHLGLGPDDDEPWGQPAR